MYEPSAIETAAIKVSVAAETIAHKAIALSLATCRLRSYADHRDSLGHVYDRQDAVAEIDAILRRVETLRELREHFLVTDAKEESTCAP